MSNRQERMAAFVARGGAKPPRPPKSIKAFRPKLAPRAAPAEGPRKVAKPDFTERALTDAYALLAQAMAERGPVLIYPMHLQILIVMASQSYVSGDDVRAEIKAYLLRAPTASPAGSQIQALKEDEPSAIWRVCKAIKGDCNHCPPRETLRGEDTVRGCYLQAMECLKAALDTPEIPSGKEGV